MSPLAAGFLAFLLAAGWTEIGWHLAWRRMRRKEYGPNRTEQPPPDDVVRWHIAHIRDDMTVLAWNGSLTNGLLAAILAVLLAR